MYGPGDSGGFPFGILKVFDQAFDDMIESIEIIIPQNQLVRFLGNSKDFFQGKCFLFIFNALRAIIAYFSNNSVC
jgi:hypothetical protein